MLEIFDKLEQNVCRVFLNEKGNGTGFLISSKFILTDYHVISKDNEIKIKFNNDELLYKVTLVELDKKYEELDIALLELSEEVDFYKYIEIEEKELKRDEKWVTRGYPSKKNGRAEEMRNDKHVIHQYLPNIEDEGFDIELNFDTSKWSSYSGLSGSPIVVNNCIVGIITSQQIDEKSKELYGLSVKHFKDLIDEVRKKEQNKNETTETIYLKNGKSFIIEMVKVELENKTLYVGKYPVTFEEYDMFCEETNHESVRSNGCNFHRENYPIVNITWNDANEYCNWLNMKESNKIFNLPSSVDWDKIVKLNHIDTNNLDDFIWHSKNTSRIQRVGSKKSGFLGIHDMYGNVHEWCCNSYDSENKIVKGESFNYFFENLKMKINYYLQNESKSVLGFRIIAIQK